MNKKLRIVILAVLFILLFLFVVPWLRFAAFIIIPNNSFGEQDIMISPLYLGYLITLLTVPIAYLLSMDKSNKSRYKVWGIAIMLPISLPLAYSIGITYSFIVGNPWATILTLYVFPVIFIIGLIILLVGIFKKDEAR
ncbi:hypothetical protein [Lentibacillus sediminis]|uniref:hypothetical protein n=1 Tax=Lentibacillus sediminis TaxID=1940529 RepID=UPI001EFCF595|nr:hypothetical protein [Lentibacillus sediminis]